MITSDQGFILATPTKCGTTTVEALANRHHREAGADADEFRLMDWDSPRRQHRMALPPNVRDRWGGEGSHIDEHDNNEDPSGLSEGWGDVDRWLLVRNPYTRYMSIYTYLSAPANYSQWGAREIQGNEWGGHDKAKIVRRSKMSFEQFLFWLADQRAKYSNDYWLSRRGELTEGFAYRSPWVWTDPLDWSLSFLQVQPGEREGDVEGLVRMENLFDNRGDWSLLNMLDAYGVEINMRPLHSNRTTGYGEAGADPSSSQFWGGIRCARKAFRGRVFDPDRAEPRGCGACAACAINVYAEAEVLGYLNDPPQLG